MKKRICALTLSCALISSALSVQAEETSAKNSDDINIIGRDLTIMGRLEKVQSGCTVLMSKYMLNLEHKENYLPEQGDPSKVSSPDDKVYIQLGGEHCDADEGYFKIGLKFIGTVDDAEGNVLGNVATGESAAKGIGIQLSDMFNDLIEPNVTIAKFPSAAVNNGKATDQVASFPLNFSLVKLKGQDVTPGSVKTNMTVQIERL